ncbi:MAG: AMP-binding protein, partial [Verrucomicrobiales bacterium]|nr:AMP-binding protein [Verrucomicrobiales bacterium]
MSDFASLDFWYAPDLHVALPPGRETPPGLVAAALPHLREGGCLFNTSGSEGPPKWVVLEKRAFLHSARAVNALHGLERSDRWGLALPQHHVGGFSIWARAALSGAAVIPWTSPHWDPKTCHQWLIDAVIRVVSLVPTQLHDFIALALPPPPELRLVIVGGGPLATDLLRRALELGWP